MHFSPVIYKWKKIPGVLEMKLILWRGRNYKILEIMEFFSYNFVYCD